jgi:hypothetical protein
MTSEGVGIPVAEDDAEVMGQLDDVGVVANGEVDGEGEEAGAVDPGGTAVNEETEKVPVRGTALDDAGGPEFGEDTGQTVVEIAIVEVTTIVECAGQLVTVGAQLVMVISVVVKTVDVVNDGIGQVVPGVDVMTAEVVGKVATLLGLDEGVEVVSVLVETVGDGVVVIGVLVGVVAVRVGGELAALLGV